MERVVQPELLDQLSPEEPAAAGSRRDLHRVNWFMGNGRHLRRAIAKHARAARTVLELGAGDGSLLLKVLPPANPAEGRKQLILLDQFDLVPAATKAKYAELGWEVQVRQQSIQEWTSSSDQAVDLILCNLFVHHFQESELREMFAAIARRTDCFICCEPWRNRFAPAATRWLFLLGCNRVTLHDARVSVLAGFREKELTRFWKSIDPAGNFGCEEREAGLFSHLFVARRAPRIG